MVFVTVGNSRQAFRRLLDAVEELAGAKFFGDEQVFVQSGHNAAYQPKHCEYTSFLVAEEFESRMRQATLIICHGEIGRAHV